MSIPTLDGFRDTDVLTPGEVAALFRVDPKTVTRWAHAGRFPQTDPITGEPVVIRTLGGHHRFRYGTIRRILAGEISLGQDGRVNNRFAQ
jgi:hypothetical protein